MTRPGALAWFGATVLWIGAAVMSFAGLYGLAVTCYISARIGWLLPLVVDLGVAVAAWVWRRGVNPEASRLAGRLTWSLLTLTIIGNGAHLGMASAHITPPWFVAAAVGAIPAAVAGTVAHLLVLLGRSVEASESRTPEPERAEPCDLPAPVKAKVKTSAPPVKESPISERVRPKQDSVPGASDVSTNSKKAAAAERSRRSRRHQVGDHSMCSPGRCPDVSLTTSRNNGVKVEVPV